MLLCTNKTRALPSVDRAKGHASTGAPCEGIAWLIGVGVACILTLGTGLASHVHGHVFIASHRVVASNKLVQRVLRPDGTLIDIALHVFIASRPKRVVAMHIYCAYPLLRDRAPVRRMHATPISEGFHCFAVPQARSL